MPPDTLVATLLPQEAPALYAAQLAVNQAGGAYLCLDPRFPDGHMRSVLDDAAPVALIADAAGRARFANLGVIGLRVIDVDEDAPRDVDASRGDPEAGKADDLPPATRDGDPDQLAYVIYTSGTTGQPKGVMIAHRSIVNLVDSCIDAFKLGPDDRVVQASSPAYDSSIEEAWLAFAVGATLVPLDDETVRFGPDLIELLRREQITAFCPPPTLLRATGCADPQAALPDVRFLYVGGEALPPDLAAIWSRGRLMVNGYGPTECTVVATRARVWPDKLVTIGRPVPGNTAWVLDESLEEVPPGEEGELCIGGVGLARGYLGRPELTRERFPEHPRLGRIYRTGDRSRVNSGGDLEYLGRIDAQVKLRGYRIELGAVEAHLAACPGVRAAGCRVQGEGRAAALAAHIQPEDADAPPDVDALAVALRSSLPEYMVPSRFRICETLPTTVGGKLDRGALPDVAAPARDETRPLVRPRDEHEARVAAAFAGALELPDEASVCDDFFLDLGGDSLSAADVILTLREPGVAHPPTFRDLYRVRTAEGVAALMRERAAAEPGARPADGGADSRGAGGPQDAPPEASTRAVLGVALAQGAWLLAGLVISSAILYFLVYVLLPPLLEGFGLVPLLLFAPLLAFVTPLVYAPLAVLWAVLVKRVLIGQYEPVRVPVWSGLYARHWIVAQTARLIPWGMLAGTVFAGAALRALGARIGHGVHVHRGVGFAGGWDLLTIGDGATLSQDASPRTVELDNGWMVAGSVSIGAGATLDVRAGMSPDSTVEADGYLTPLSWLPPGGRVPRGERWDGVPAVPAGRSPEPLRKTMDGRTFTPARHGLVMVLVHALLRAAATLPLVVVGLLITRTIPDAGSLLLAWLEAPVLSWPLLAVVLGLSIVLLPVRLILQALGLRAMGRTRTGVHDRWSLETVRVWVKTGAVSSAGRWLSGALFWMWWLRLAGMRIGRCSEVSTIIDVVPETVAIGDESFFADGIYFCGPRVHGGTVAVEPTTVGRGTFLGNHAVVPPGQDWPDDLFLGVSTVADPALVRPDSGWFGHPPFELPRREVVTIDRRLTHEPDGIRYVTRLFFETLRFLLPVLPLCLALLWVWLVAGADDLMGAVAFYIVGLPSVTLVTMAAAVVAVLALKWGLLGRVRPGQHPFWSCWCARWDLVYVAWSVWARGALSALEGSLYLNAVLRLFGMGIGRRVVLGQGFAQVVDPDMLRFDDGATVTCQFQAHSFEDRVLKIDHLRIGRGATVGYHTVTFYGVDVGDGAHVAPHGVIMKRDALPAGRVYAGNPVQDQG